MALTTQLPTVTNVSVVPETVQMVGDPEVNATVSPDVAVAERVIGVVLNG